jgi:hypothetical protein
VLLTFIALLAGTLCVAVAVRRWRMLLRLSPRPQPAPGASSARARAELAAAELVGPQAAARLVSDVLDAPTRKHSVAELNERLSDAAREIDVGREVPRSAARVALASGTLLAVIELVRTLPEGQASVKWALVAFSCGLASAMGTRYAGRLADSRAEQLREAWNELARMLTRLLPPEPGDERGRGAGDGS